MVLLFYLDVILLRNRLRPLLAFNCYSDAQCVPNKIGIN